VGKIKKYFTFLTFIFSIVLINIKGENTMQLDNQLYNNFKNMVFSKTSKFNHNYRIDRDELLAQANLIFCECYYNYQTISKTKKLSFPVFLFNQLEWNLLKYAKKEKQKKEIIAETIYCSNYCDNSQEAILFEDFIKQFSPKTKNMLRIICKPDRRQRKEFNTMNKKQLRKYLRMQGWKHTDISNCYNEIEIGLEKWRK
jgi:hypothetical protein